MILSLFSGFRSEQAAQQPEAKEVQQKSAQQLEAERQQKLETLRTAMQKQICAIHADVELSANGQNDSGAVEQKLHVLLYKSTLPENDLNRALDELRTERRRQKAEYQGAPFADVFLVNLILSDEDSERAYIVDVGDTVMSYIYKKLHDLDYFLLRYGPKDVAKYVEDDSTVSKYYGTLPFY